MSEAAIKGMAGAAIAADVLRLLDEGVLSREALEARLEAADLLILDAKVQVAQWYPLASFARLLEVLMEAEGGGDPEYVVERGRRAAQRLQASGIYSQLSANRETWGDQVGSIMATLGPGLYRDSEWRFELLEGGSSRPFRSEATVSADFPDLFRYSTQGFIHFLTDVVADVPYRVTSERPSATQLVFRGEPRGD